MKISIIIMRHRNTRFTTYQLSGESFTASEATFRLRCDDGVLLYSRGSLRFTDENMEQLDARAVQLATALFALPGVVNDKFDNTGVVIKKDEMTVTRDSSATTDEQLEARIIEVIANLLGIAASEIEWAVDDHEQSEEFCHKLDVSAQESLDHGLFDDFGDLSYLGVSGDLDDVGHFETGYRPF